jgi:carboxymethylenebutenolidase
VVLLHEALVLNDDIREPAFRLAAAGHVALLPDAYTDGGAPRTHCRKGKALEDIESARRWLVERPAARATEAGTRCPPPHANPPPRQ